MRIPRLGCLGWVIAAIVFVAACALIGYLWYHSTTDIREVEKEARAAGIPPTWAEAGLFQSDPATLATFHALVALSEKTPSWTKDHYLEMPRIGEDPPQELRDHHRAISPYVWDELTEKISRLSSKPVVLYADPQQYYVRSGSGWFDSRELCRLFTERLLIVPLNEIPPLVLAASQAAQIVSPQALIDQMVIDSLVGIVAQGVTLRLSELRGTSAGTACAQHLRVLRDMRWNTRTQVWTAQIMMGKELPPGAFGSGSFAMSYEFEKLWYNTKEKGKKILQPLAWRGQRADAIRMVLQYALAYKKAKDPTDLTRQIAAIVSPPSMALQWAAALDCDSGIGGFPLMDRAFVHALLKLDVVIAELEGSPLPTDYFSPTQAPLKPVIRAGKQIGWYSVGQDGVDNGGSGPFLDFGIPTDGTFGRQHFADEPEKKLPKPKAPVTGRPPGVVTPPPVANPPPTEVVPSP